MKASEEVTALRSETGNINQIWVTIGSTFERANSLGLNVANEVVRAGEQGCSFAVVADEVCIHTGVSQRL